MPLLPTLCACENVIYNTVAQAIVNFAWNMWKTQKDIIVRDCLIVNSLYLFQEKLSLKSTT